MRMGVALAVAAALAAGCEFRPDYDALKRVTDDPLPPRPKAPVKQAAKSCRTFDPGPSAPRPKPMSASLKRMLGKAPRRPRDTA